jgi:hypothetical protein
LQSLNRESALHRQVLPKLTQEIMDKIDEILGNKPKPHQIHQDVLGFRKYPAM